MKYVSPFAVTEYLSEESKKTRYIDKLYTGTDQDYYKELEESCTVYVGHLPMYFKEEQIYILFSQKSKIKRIIMGLDSRKYMPCGFCFVEFETMQEVLDTRRSYMGCKLDRNTIYVDLDTGFSENRQFGRGALGGQVGNDPQAQRKRRKQYA